MKALLINPWIYDFAAYDLWVRPVGLLKLSTYLKKQGYEVFYLDCLDFHKKLNQYQCGKYKKEKIQKPECLKYVERDYFRYGISYEQVLEKLKSFPKPDIIYMSSMMTYWYPAVRDMIKLCRIFFPDTKIILGGIYAELMPEHAMTVCKPDRIVTQHDCFPDKGELKGVSPLSLNNDAFLASNLNSVRQDRTILSNKKVHILQTSYGCPFTCSYCASKKIMPSFIQRDVDDILNEIVWAYNDGAEEFVFYDDALLVKSDNHIKKILKKIIDKNIKINLHTPNGLHARFLDKECAELMCEVGFKTVRLSLETSNEKLQQSKGNKVCANDFENAILNLKNAGFKTCDIDVYVMMGLIGQTQEQLHQDIAYVHKQGAKIVLASYSPVFGTEDYDDLVRRKVIKFEEDPVLLNNTIFIYETGYDINIIRQIRKMVSELNSYE